MLKSIVLSICAVFPLCATSHAAKSADSAARSAVVSTAAAAPPPDFESLRVKGFNIALPGPEDTIDPDFAGIRTSLAALGIGDIGFNNNNFYNNKRA